MRGKLPRRQFLKLAGTGLAAGALSCSRPEDRQGPVPPGQRLNILWIGCEDLSPDLGCYGSREVRTPHLDRLARQGLRLTNAFAVAPVGDPNREGILTGMYPTAIGAMHTPTHCPSAGFDYEPVPPPYVRCFTEYLREAGYFCTSRAPIDRRLSPPLTAWDHCGEQHQDWAGRDPGQPFFAVVDFGEIGALPGPEPQGAGPRHDPRQVSLPPCYPDDPAVRGDQALYLDRIERLDARVGELLARLEADGLADRTVVFFMSGHGSGMPRARGWLYDSGLRVPLLVRWPGAIQPGTVGERLVSAIDLAPTVLSLAGVSPPSYLQGQAFLGPDDRGRREYVFAARDRLDQARDLLRAVRDGRFKYIRNYRPELPYSSPIASRDRLPAWQAWQRLAGEGRLEGPPAAFFRDSKPPEELYDCREDPHEIRNLAGDPHHADTLRRLRLELERWVARTGDLGQIPEERLVEMIWPGGSQPITAAPSIHRLDSGPDQPVRVELSCPTPGASLAWTTDRGDQPRWRLYCEPLEFRREVSLRARAFRLGFAGSEEANFLIAAR